MNCIFCRILAGELPATFLLRTPTIAAFMDIRPVNPGHILVIPVQHAEFIADVPSPTAAEMFTAAQNMVRALRASGLPCEGINLFLADGTVAGQEVPHTHLHIFPRTQTDAVRLHFPDHYAQLPPRAILESHAQKIRQLLTT